MKAMHELKLLVQDTLALLQKEKKQNSFFFLSDASFDFFQPYIQQYASAPKNTLEKPKPAAFLPLENIKAAIQPPPPSKTALINKLIVPAAAKKPEKKEFREPEKPAYLLTLSLDHFKDLMQLIEPRLKILDIIPSDQKAKEIASSWKFKAKVGKITLLAFKENPKELFFIKELAKALHLLFQPTKIINAAALEKEDKWDFYLSQPHLKLLLITDTNLWKLKNLVKYYHENPTTGETFLKNTPVMLLPQISFYLKEPLMKKTLYENLKKKIREISFI